MGPWFAPKPGDRSTTPADRQRRPGTAPGAGGGSYRVGVPAQLARTARMLQLAQRLGLDLAHALARDLEDGAHLFERARRPVPEAEAQADDLLLAPRQRREH